MALDQRLSLITLGTADMARARAFYEGVLGWTPFFEVPTTCFYDLGGLVLGLYAHEGLQGETRREPAAAPDAYRGFALAQNLRSVEAVDEAFARLKAAGATILAPPHKMEWGGYSGYAADPDGHPWEIAFNPGWTVLPDGRLDVTKGPDA